MKFPDCDEPDTDYVGNDINSDKNDDDYGSGAGKRDSLEQCRDLCKSRKRCNFFSYKKQSKECWLKTSDSGKRLASGTISGTTFCGNVCNSSNAALSFTFINIYTYMAVCCYILMV